MSAATDAGIQAETLRDHVHDRLREVFEVEMHSGQVWASTLDEVVDTATDAATEHLLASARDARRQILAAHAPGQIRSLIATAIDTIVALIEQPQPSAPAVDPARAALRMAADEIRGYRDEYDDVPVIVRDTLTRAVRIVEDLAVDTGAPRASVTREQVDAARHAVIAEGRNVGYLPVGVAEVLLAELGIEVRA